MSLNKSHTFYMMDRRRRCEDILTFQCFISFVQCFKPELNSSGVQRCGLSVWFCFLSSVITAWTKRFLNRAAMKESLCLSLLWTLWFWTLCPVASLSLTYLTKKDSFPIFKMWGQLQQKSKKWTWSLCYVSTLCFPEQLVSVAVGDESYRGNLVEKCCVWKLSTRLVSHINFRHTLQIVGFVTHD